jgi:hypothetical protein
MPAHVVELGVWMYGFIRVRPYRCLGLRMLPLRSTRCIHQGTSQPFMPDNLNTGTAPPCLHAGSRHPLCGAGGSLEQRQRQQRTLSSSSCSSSRPAAATSSARHGPAVHRSSPRHPQHTQHTCPHSSAACGSPHRQLSYHTPDSCTQQGCSRSCTCTRTPCTQVQRGAHQQHSSGSTSRCCSSSGHR